MGRDQRLCARSYRSPPGRPVTVKAPALGIATTGTISFIGPIVGEVTRTAIARIVLANPDELWRPGLPVTAEVVADEVRVPVTVRTEAIQSLRDSTVVFGRYDQSFEARPITIGRRDGNVVEVLSGLRAGERYAATNSFLIKADIGKSGLAMTTEHAACDIDVAGRTPSSSQTSGV